MDQAGESDGREGEVRELDTYALEELVDAMRPLASAADVTRVRHVVAAAAHVTDSLLTIPPGASLDEARRVVEQWEDRARGHVAEAATPADPVIGCDLTAEQFVEGREFYVGVLGNVNARALPVIELDFSKFPADRPRIASWAAKWG